MSPKTKTPQPHPDRLAEAFNRFIVPAIQKLPREVVAELLKQSNEQESA